MEPFAHVLNCSFCREKSHQWDNTCVSRKMHEKSIPMVHKTRSSFSSSSWSARKCSCFRRPNIPCFPPHQTRNSIPLFARASGIFLTTISNPPGQPPPVTSFSLFFASRVLLVGLLVLFEAAEVDERSGGENYLILALTTRTINHYRCSRVSQVFLTHSKNSLRKFSRRAIFHLLKERRQVAAQPLRLWAPQVGVGEVVDT